MRAVAITTALAVIGSVQAAGWQDNNQVDSTTPAVPEKPTKPTETPKVPEGGWTTSTTTAPSKETTAEQSYWGDVPVPTGGSDKPEGGDKPETPEGGAGKPEQPEGGKPEQPEGGAGKPEQPEGGAGKPEQPEGGKPEQPEGGKPQQPEGGAGKPEQPEGGKPQQPEGGAGKPEQPEGGAGKPEQPEGGKPEQPEGGAGKPTSPEETPEGGDKAWENIPSEETSTLTLTGTKTSTIYVESNTWADVPAPETPAPEVPVGGEKPAEDSSTWIDWASSAAGADECVITVITKYGEPTWVPSAEGPAESSWVEAEVPATPAESTPAVETWADVPATPVGGETPAESTPAVETWADVPATPVEGETPAESTWADVPVPTQPVSGDKGEECKEYTVTEVVEITVTATEAPNTWADVAVPTGGAGKPQQPEGGAGKPEQPEGGAGKPEQPEGGAGKPEQPEGGAGKPEQPEGGAGKPEQPESSKPVEGGAGKPTKPASTTPSVETSTTAEHTWADVPVPTGEPEKPVEGGKDQPEKPVEGGKDQPEKPTETKPTSPEESKPASEDEQQYWGDAQLGADSGSWGMTYSPYTAGGNCKDAGVVDSDFAKMAGKGFSTVRVYSTDCNTLENAGSAAKKHGMKLILGVFIADGGIYGAKDQVTDITSWAQWDLVELIVVGNEAVFNGKCTATELAGFIGSSKQAFQAAGYNGPVTTTETLAEWEKDGAAFCAVVDVVSANLYAFFNADTTADKAGDLIQAQIKELRAICPGKDVYVMESGWPSAGECNGKACPSPENQKTAVQSIKETSGSNIIWFSYEDETWKEPGEFGVEQHWGCLSAF